MGFVILTVLSSLAISLILKFNETRSGDRIIVAGTNYVVAATLGLLFSSPFSSVSPALPSPGWIAFGALTGIGFVAGFLLLMRSMKEIGLAVTASVARTATLGPVLLAILFYDERPGIVEITGVGIGLLAFLLLGIAQRKPGERFSLNPAALGLLTGVLIVMILNDFAMKVTQFNNVPEAAFLLIVFGVAGLLCWGFVFMRRASHKTVLRKHDVLLGAVLGIPNYFSSYFLILALQNIPATTVFPIVSASGVVASTFAAVLIWKERPSATAWCGIGLATLAVILLGVGH